MKRNLLSLLCIFATLHLSAQNILTVADPNSNPNQKTRGIITHPEITITPKGAYAEVDMIFTFNAEKSYPQSQMLEAVLNFTLPGNAFIHDSWLWLNDTTIIKADVIEKDKATQIYQGIVIVKRDPSLLVKTGVNSYQLNVYPMTTVYPRKVKLSYSVPFNWMVNKAAIELPLNIFATSATAPSLVIKIVRDNRFNQPVLNEKNINDYSYNTTTPGMYTIIMPGQEYSKGQSISLSYTANTGNTAQLDIYPTSATEYVYQMTVPQNVIGAFKPKKTVIVLDHDGDNASIFNLEQVKSYLKTSLLTNNNPTDSFNLFYIHNNAIVQAGTGWRATDAPSVIYAADAIPNTLLSDSYLYDSLLKTALAFCKSSGDAQAIILSSSGNYDTQPKADFLINSINNAIGSFTNKINCINYRITGSSFTGNDLLFKKITILSGGNYYKAETSKQYTVDNKAVKTYDLNMLNALTDIYLSGAVATNNYDINFTTSNSISFARFKLNGNNWLHHNAPYMETGKSKYYGGMSPVAMLQIQMLTPAGYTNVLKPMNVTVYTDSAMLRPWAHRNIEYMLQQNNKALAKEIIDSSIRNRILCTTTAFLAVETGDTLRQKDIIISTGIAKPQQNMSLITCYPNPFSDRLTISFTGDVESVDIFDMLGRKVYTRKIAKQETNITWNGTGNNGQALAPGLYMIVARTATETATLKVTKQ